MLKYLNKQIFFQIRVWNEVFVATELVKKSKQNTKWAKVQINRLNCLWISKFVYNPKWLRRYWAWFVIRKTPKTIRILRLFVAGPENRTPQHRRDTMAKILAASKSELKKKQKQSKKSKSGGFESLGLNSMEVYSF